MRCSGHGTSVTPRACARAAPAASAQLSFGVRHIDIAAQYSPSEFVLHAFQTKPRCLEPFTANAIAKPAKWLDPFDDACYFDITCSCGGTQFTVSGHWVWAQEKFFTSPHSLECSACCKAALVFDIETHGFDAELGHGSSYLRGTEKSTTFACPQCDGSTFEVVIGINYQIGPMDELTDDEKKKMQDLFDGFWINVVCTQCEKPSLVTGYECA